MSSGSSKNLINKRCVYWLNSSKRKTKYKIVCFVLRHINLIDHLMPNQVKENKSGKKIKEKVLGINYELMIISWLFVFLFGVYL